MDSHPKKKKSTEQIRNQITVTSLAEINTVYTLYKAKANQTPLPNTAIQRCLSKKKKKKNQIQSKKETKYKANQNLDPEQTKPTVAPPLLAGAARSATSVARRRHLVIVTHSPVVLTRRLPAVIARRLPIAADRRSVSPSQLLRRSALRYFFLFFSLTLSLSLSLSHTLK